MSVSQDLPNAALGGDRLGDNPVQLSQQGKHHRECRHAEEHQRPDQRPFDGTPHPSAGCEQAAQTSLACRTQ
jgi:hypothetical protein